MPSKSRKRRERRKKLKNKQHSNTMETMLSKESNSYDEYDLLSNDELILLISGYTRNIHLFSQIIPKDIINCISLYHWFKLYDNFNSFRFKFDLKENKIRQNFSSLKYYVMPLNELKSKYLLPFDEIFYDKNNNKKIGKYSSFTSNYSPKFIKQKECMIHRVELDKNDENIYHLMDSFVVNKFIQLFDDEKAENHWETKKPLPAGKGPHRAGFRCVGNIKKPDLSYFNEKAKYRNIWKFMGGNFYKLELNQSDFVQKCLLNKFDIKLKFDENYKIDKETFDSYSKTSSNNMNDSELSRLLYDVLKESPSWDWDKKVRLSDIVWRFDLIDYLTPKELVCDKLYNKIQDKLDDNHWIVKKLIKWRKKLNIDKKIKDAENEEKRKKAKERKEKRNEKEKKEEEDDAYKGNWTSWAEIDVSNNDINDVFEILMTDIIFSRNYSYGLNSLSQMDYDDWTLQRPIFGKKFLELFSKNGKKNKIRAFWCRHIAWDMFDEDYLSGDKILCCVDNDKIVVVWSLICRLYG